ncbi:hypothetical protein HF521_018411, partial [Silurus meridionalis]
MTPPEDLGGVVSPFGRLGAETSSSEELRSKTSPPEEFRGETPPLKELLDETSPKEEFKGETSPPGRDVAFSRGARERDVAFSGAQEQDSAEHDLRDTAASFRVFPEAELGCCF